MLRSRIIPSLLVHRGGLYKTVRFQNASYVGDPINAVKIFNEKEADELAVFDIDATVNQSEPDYVLIARLAAECRMPLCYGGGIRTAGQAQRIISLGVEKVAISSAALENPKLVAQIAGEIGAQSVVVVLDVRQGRDGCEVWTHNGHRRVEVDPFTSAVEFESLGAGEIVVNSIDRDGSMAGYDLELAKRFRSTVSLPLTILGGAGSLEHISELIKRCGTIGAAAGSLFVYKGPFRAVLINYPDMKKRDELVQHAVGRE